MTSPPHDPPPAIVVDTPSLAEAEAAQAAEDQRQFELSDASEKTKQLKALFVNRMYVSPDGGQLRISLGEFVGGENIFHTAFRMTLEDAYAFAELLRAQSSAAYPVLIDHYRKVIAQLDSDDGQSAAG